VLLDENGRIMLIDFGIAKESDPSTMTRTLGRAATHGFSPPEQAMGTGTDQRSDIYALAATLYALLTGKNPPAAHERIAGKDLVPPSQVVPGISPLLDQALLKALNLNVNHRQQTMQEFALALEAVDTGAGPKSQPTLQDSERTVAVSPQAATVRSSPSLKLPGAPTAAASGRVTPASIAIPYAAPRRNPLLPIAIGVAAVAALAIAAYLFWPKQEEPPAPPVAAQQPAAPAAPPAATLQAPVATPPPQPAVTAQPPALPTQQIPAVIPQPPVAPPTVAVPTQPVAPVAPPTAPQPVQTPVRAADFLKGREPDPVPAYEPPRTVEPRRATAPKPRREPSAASSSSGSSSSSEPVFTIQREGSRRTD
jgi:serine/threonine-protein kinase